MKRASVSEAMVQSQGASDKRSIEDGTNRAEDGYAMSARRPRLALVAHGINDLGGMEHAFAELARRASRDFEVVVVSSELAEDLRRVVEWKRVRVPTRPMPLRFALFQVIGGFRLMRAKADLVHTLGAIVPNRVDMASVHFCHAGFYTATGRLAPDGPLLRRINTGLTRALSLAAERWSYRPGHVRLVTAVSRGVERELREHFPRIQVAVIPNGVDEPAGENRDREGLRTKYGVSDDDVLVLFVGGDWDRKGLAVAIGGVAQAREAGASGLRLWVVGQGDEDRFAEMAREYGVDSTVTFFGPQTDISHFYEVADVVVLPSLYEALPLVALEALAAGIPLIATRVNGVEELFEGETPGILVERTAESVAAALIAVAQDSDLRVSMGRVGKRLSEQFTWERSTGHTLDLYHRLLAKFGSREGSV